MDGPAAHGHAPLSGSRQAQPLRRTREQIRFIHVGGIQIRIAILDDYQDVSRSMADWEGLGADEIRVFTDRIESKHDLAKLLEPFDIIVAMRERTQFDRNLLEDLPNLRLLISTGMWNAAIDVATAESLGVTVCGTGGVASAAPELTWGLIIALMRHIPSEDSWMRAGAAPWRIKDDVWSRNGGWQRTIGAGLAGKTLGLVGLGIVGGQVARVASAFDMKVVAWSENLTKEAAREHGVEHVSKLALFEQSDIVSLHVRLSERTRGLVGQSELRKMKESAYLVNTARGPIIDEEALILALQEERIAGAALDVFEQEPLPAGHVLRRLPNTVITPHIGYVTAETYRKFYEDAVGDIEAYLAGEPVRVLSASDGAGS